MKVRVARESGFCMGVRRAMEIALEALHRGQGPIYSYGPLIHNPQALEMLKSKGLRVIRREDLPHIETPGAVIIRAHGVPPEEREALQKAGLTVIDATCPRVIRVQAIIQRHAAQGYTPLIVGDADHAEVVGLLGHAKGRGHVIRRASDVDALPEPERVLVVAQTTQSPALFQEMVEAVRACWPDALIFDTICGATHRRQQEIRRLSGQVQAMVVVGGHDSGNTTRLAEVARSEGLRTIHLETEEELSPEFLEGIEAVGVTAGASTPNWMIKRVVRQLERIARERTVSLTTLGHRLLRILVLSNGYVALGAAGLMAAGALLQGLAPTLALLGAAFFYVHAMHMLNLYLDKEAARFNDPDRAMFLESHRGLLFGGSLFSAAAGLGLGLLVSLDVFLLILITGVVGLLYSVRLVPERFRGRTRFTRLKDIPASKTFSVAGGWALSLSLMPLLAEGQRLGPAVVLVAGVVFLLVFVRSALSGIFDIQGDRIVGQESIPILIGEDKTLRLLYGACALAALALAGGWIVGWLPSLALWLLVLPVWAAFYLVLYQKQRFVVSLPFEVLADANFLLAGLLAWVWWHF